MTYGSLDPRSSSERLPEIEVALRASVGPGEIHPYRRLGFLVEPETKTCASGDLEIFQPEFDGPRRDLGLTSANRERQGRDCHDVPSPVHRDHVNDPLRAQSHGGALSALGTHEEEAQGST